MSRRRWFVPLAFAAVLGTAVGLVASAGRYVAHRHFPPPTAAESRAFSHNATLNLLPPGLILPDGGVLFGGSGGYDVRVHVTAAIDRSPLFENSDAKVSIAVNVGPDGPPEALETIQLESESFGIVPHGGVQKIEVRNGAGYAEYAITPHGSGDKMLRVYAQYSLGGDNPRVRVDSPIHEEILTAKVLPMPNPTTFGVSKDTWTALQAVGTAIGAPSLLVLIVTKLLDARKKKAEEKPADDGPKIILPK